MPVNIKLDTKELALAVCLTALYVVFGAVKVSPIIGLPGQAITAAAIMAPVMGIIFGPFISMLSTFLGGVIGFSFGYFSMPSFTSGITAAVCSGLTSKGRRITSAVVYLSFFLLLAFYPVIGPAWLYPPLLWFQIIGFMILVSPLQSIAIRNLHSDDDSKLFYAFFITSLTSTLAGQIAGSVTFEAMLLPDLDYWRGTWIATTFLYPIERIIIATCSCLIGTALFRILKKTNFVSFLNGSHP
jgi:uncharacterized membrane protein